MLRSDGTHIATNIDCFNGLERANMWKMKSTALVGTHLSADAVNRIAYKCIQLKVHFDALLAYNHEKIVESLMLMSI